MFSSQFSNILDKFHNQVSSPSVVNVEYLYSTYYICRIQIFVLVRIFVLVNLELLQMGELALVRGFTHRFVLKF